MYRMESKVNVDRCEKIFLKIGEEIVRKSQILKLPRKP